VDIVLTDPPYDFDNDQKAHMHAQFLRISRGGAIVFSPPENQWILPAGQYGFWVKPTSTKNTSRRYSRFVEMLFFYGPLKWNAGRHWTAYTNVFQELVDDVSKHPFRKPPALIERLILNHSDVGDIILDPFAGSGIVSEIGTRLGRKVISIERERQNV
jgi:DNA modification methylase